MKILLVNDDGIHAPGLKALRDELLKFADVTVVAPALERSGASYSVTLNTILKVDEVYKKGEFYGYAVHGTPVDCSMIALQELMDEKPDYLFSGINLGSNLSTHVHYSGTVSAASEGPIAGITSVAVSLSTYKYRTDFSAAATMAGRWLKLMEEGKVPKGCLYNINVPGKPLEELKGFALSHLSPNAFKMQYERRQSPRGELYFWICGVDVPDSVDKESDMGVMREGYVSVTPVKIQDRTDYEIIEEIKKNRVFDE